MNYKNFFEPSSRGYLARVAVTVGVLAFSIPGQATIVPLSDGNSTASVDLDSAAGMYEWKVDGQNQLNKQWFYFRTDAGLAQPINAISGAAYDTFGSLNLVQATYTSAQLTLQISYFLTGGGAGSGTADILESITVYNNTLSPLNFHFFQYSDFDLGGTPGGDSIAISGSPSGYDYVLQSKGPGMSIGEAIVSPFADRAETDNAFNTLNSLTTTPGYDLNNVLSSGPGNVTWALQWDATIAVGGSFEVFKDKRLEIAAVPEPSMLALLGVGLSVLGLVNRRRIQ